MAGLTNLRARREKENEKRETGDEKRGTRNGKRKAGHEERNAGIAKGDGAVSSRMGYTVVMVTPDSRGLPSCAAAGEDFRDLVERVAACCRCSTMQGRRRVLSDLNGPLDALVLFVAEAPGRFGADRTGVPLSRDRSGRNFERLLACATLSRNEVFVTNAVLCNPRDSRDRNRPPSDDELTNCASHLQEQLDLVRAPVVASLGLTALRALDRIEPHGLNLRDDVAQPTRWRGRLLVPLYHPGAQAMLHRPLIFQEEDYRALGRLVRELSGASARMARSAQSRTSSTTP
jgi:uracil-DNA glycosylase family 4